jgi:hypothetical protein
MFPSARAAKPSSAMSHKTHARIRRPRRRTRSHQLHYLLRILRQCQSLKKVTNAFEFQLSGGRAKKMKGVHKRDTGPMLSSLRCGARTRAGGSCRSPAVSGMNRCRMHGGAPGSGAPLGNKNALKHGLYTREAKAERRRVRTLLWESRKLLEHQMNGYR